MVLAGRKALIVLFVWGAASILFLGSWGYSLFVRADLAASPRFLGERLLYAGIVCACVFLVLFFRLFLRSRGVIRELDRLVELSKHGGLPSSAGLKAREGRRENRAAVHPDQRTERQTGPPDRRDVRPH